MGKGEEERGGGMGMERKRGGRDGDGEEERGEGWGKERK